MADLRVLVVDDEELILQVMKEFFRQRGDHCETAGNGTEALRFIEDRIYDLVLSDISMPGMDGLELVRRIKTLQPAAVCILMSGLGTRRDIISALKIGVFDFVDKPIPDLAQLTMIVDRAGESGRLLRERDSLLENLKQQNSKLEYSLLRLHEAFGQLRRQEEALESDLQKAQRVQRKFLPSGFPRLEGTELFGYYAPCDQLGGDFFGSFQFDDGRIAVYLVDVAGHGVSAAMVTVTFRELMRARQRMSGGDQLFTTPDQVLQYMNTALLEENFDPPIFVSMIYGVLDPKSGHLVLASAGHPSPVCVNRQGELREVPVTGCVLGTKCLGDYATTEFDLQPDEALLLYSDGLSDARSSGGEEFSRDRLRSILATEHASSALQIGDKIETQLLQHLSGVAASDDVTFIVLSRPAAQVDTLENGPAPGGLVPGSVKIVMPDKLRHIRTDTRGRLEAGWREKDCIIRMIGAMTWQVAPALREMFLQGKDRSKLPLHVDLAECETMDSTALGLLLQHAEQIVLHQPGSRVVSQLHEMGVLPLFTISHEPCQRPTIPMAIAANDTQKACSELILSAHEALMEASATNKQRFKAVVDTLRAGTPNTGKT